MKYIENYINYILYHFANKRDPTMILLYKHNEIYRNHLNCLKIINKRT